MTNSVISYGLSSYGITYKNTFDLQIRLLNKIVALKYKYIGNYVILFQLNVYVKVNLAIVSEYQETSQFFEKEKTTWHKILPSNRTYI